MNSSDKLLLAILCCWNIRTSSNIVVANSQFTSCDIPTTWRDWQVRDCNASLVNWRMKPVWRWKAEASALWSSRITKENPKNVSSKFLEIVAVCITQNFSLLPSRENSVTPERTCCVVRQFRLAFFTLALLPQNKPPKIPCFLAPKKSNT